MISRFRVENYKALSHVDIPLTPVHVIIGQNDSGKSSLLEAISAFCRSSTPQTQLSKAFEGNWQGTELVSFGAAEPVISFSAQLEGVAEGKLQSLEYGFKVRFTPTLQRSCQSFSEWWSDGQPHKIEPDPNYLTWVAQRFDPHIKNEKALDLHRIGTLIGSSSLYRLDAKQMAFPAAIDERRAFRMESDGFGLPTLLDDILGHDAETFLRLSKDFCDFFPEFKRVRIQTEKGISRDYDDLGMPRSGSSTGKGIYFESHAGGEVRAQQASDGAILFLGFLSLFYTPSPPKVLLIEEPEKGVYPKRLAQIVRILKSFIETKGDREVPQVIFTTHSPYILSEFTPDEVTVMRRVGDSVTARPLRDAPNIEERLGGGEFYLGELWYNLDEEELFQDGRSASPH